MLDVDCRPHVYARLQQFFYVLPALGVTRTFYVGVCQLIDQQHCRAARQRGVEIEFFECATPVGNFSKRQLCETNQQISRFATAVRFDHAHQHVAPRLVFALRRAEHREGFSNSCAGTKVDAQLAASAGGFSFSDLLQKPIRVWPGIKIARHVSRAPLVSDAPVCHWQLAEALRVRGYCVVSTT